MCATHLIEQLFIVELITIMVAAVFTISYNSKSKSGEKITVPIQKTKGCSVESEAKKKRQLWKNSKNKKLNHVYPEDMIKPSTDKLSEEGVTKTVGYVSCYLSDITIGERAIFIAIKSKIIALHPRTDIEM